MVSWEKFIDENSSSTPPRFDATSDFTFLLIQDWLQQLKLHATLSALSHECLGAEIKTPASDKWYEMASLLDHASFVQEHQQKEDRAPRPLLEMVVSFALVERQKSIVARAPLNPTVFVSKRLPPMHSKKLCQGGGEGCMMRPRSAAVCKSTSALLRTGQFTEDIAQPKQMIQYQEKQSLIPSFGGAKGVEATKTGKSRRIKSATTNRQKDQGVSEGLSVATRRSSTMKVHDNLGDCHRALPQGLDSDDGELEFDTMNENRISKRFGSLPQKARRQIHRVAIKSSASSQEFLKSKEIIDKIHFRSKRRQMEHLLSENSSTRVVVEAYSSEPCSLCEHQFPKRNLSMRVSYKSIYDLRASWTAARSSEPGKSPIYLGHSISSEQFQRHRQQSPQDADEDRGNDQENQQEEASRASRAHFYDEVPICVFCSQLVLNFKSYRPTKRDLKQKEIDRIAIRAQEQEEEQQRQRTRFDPLDYDRTLDDEEPDSDTEEVWLPDTDGRMVLAHRQKRRNHNQRLAVATSGAAAKQIHYAKQHLDSPSRLNAAEWHIINTPHNSR